MKRTLALLTLALGPAAGATGYADMIAAIEKAQVRVIVYAPSIYDLQLGDALRRARLDPIRKVKVRILSVPFYNYQPSSVMLSLALAGVPVYEAQIPSLSGVVIVDHQGWKGDALGRMVGAQVMQMTAREVNSHLSWFQATLKKSGVLTQIEAFERLNKVTP